MQYIVSTPLNLGGVDLFWKIAKQGGGWKN